MFITAPVIRNVGGKRGIFAEANFADASEESKEIFVDVYKSFAGVVPIGLSLTGGQWIEAIKAYLGERIVPLESVQTFLGVVNDLMMVDSFHDYSVLHNAFGDPVWAGTKGECIEAQYELTTDLDNFDAWKVTNARLLSASAIEKAKLNMSKMHAKSNGFRLIEDTSRQAAPDEVVFPRHYYSTVRTRVFAKKEDLENPENIALRSLQSMQSFGAASEASRTEMLHLMRMLSNNLGYSSFVYPATDSGDDDDAAGVFTFAKRGLEIKTEDDMNKILSNWVYAKMSRGTMPKMVHLCRPAPVVNTAGCREIFETMVTEKWVGLQLPEFMLT